MIHIVTDSSAMLAEDSCPHTHFHVTPLHIVYNGQSRLDGKDIQAGEIVSLCQSGTVPTTSQPSVGEKIDLYTSILEDPKAEILDITMADGLSGTYQTACMARDICPDPERVTVLNSHTLAGPHRHLVRSALSMRDSGSGIQEICRELNRKSASDLSMVAVSDCLYLAHSGRVSSLAGTAGAMMRLIPVAGTAEEGSRLHLFRTSRTMKKAIQFMSDSLAKRGADSSFRFFVAHADSAALAEYACSLLASRFPGARIELDPLCALFTVHGGPGAISIQAIPA